MAGADLGSRGDGPDFLCHEHKAAAVQRHVESFHPTHFAVTSLHLLIIGPIELNAIAPVVLGEITRLVGGTERITDSRQGVIHYDDTNTAVDRENPAFQVVPPLGGPAPD